MARDFEENRDLDGINLASFRQEVMKAMTLYHGDVTIRQEKLKELFSTYIHKQPTLAHIQAVEVSENVFVFHDGTQRRGPYIQGVKKADIAWLWK